LPAVDAAFVDVDEDTDVLTVTVDPAFAALLEAEQRNAISVPSALEDTLELVGGTMTLEFAGGGQTVTGNVVFTGGDPSRLKSCHSRRVSAKHDVLSRVR
jgi:hypothetical protein